MTTKFVKILFAIAVLVLIMISAIAFNHINKVSESGDLVIHTHEVQIELNQLLSFVKDAESEQRGFLITKDSNFLDPILKDKYHLQNSFSILKKLTVDNTAQAKDLVVLQSLVRERLDLLTSTINIDKTAPNYGNILIANIKKGKALMEKIDSSISILKQNENEFLKKRKAKYDSNLLLTPIISAFFFIFSLCIFIFSFIKINKDLNVKKVAFEALTINSAIMYQAEEIGDFFTWQWNIVDGTYKFSSNLNKMLGYGPDDISPSLQSFLLLTHPDDIEIIKVATKRVIETNVGQPNYFRMLHKNGTVLYMKSNSKMLTDFNGKQNVIGLTTDVTKDYLHNQSITEKNYELKANNEELSSFNHIASHDLQEPLRKIQIFISRIPEVDINIMTTEGQVFLEKIKQTVSRMRDLISDLLTYSQASKDAGTFEEVDINILLDKAINELSVAIEERGALIVRSKLPTINVIPFQIQQLFANLISNSLKYAKQNIAPQISIDCILVKAHNIEGLINEKNYYQFTFKDNGIGFDQSFASTIFTLFKRLHGTTTYKGSGIGLSICKKIVDNHKGIIKAQSENSDGATFTFYIIA